MAGIRGLPAPQPLESQRLRADVNKLFWDFRVLRLDQAEAAIHKRLQQWIHPTEDDLTNPAVPKRPPDLLTQILNEDETYQVYALEHLHHVKNNKPLAGENPYRFLLWRLKSGSKVQVKVGTLPLRIQRTDQTGKSPDTEIRYRTYQDVPADTPFEVDLDMAIHCIMRHGKHYGAKSSKRASDPQHQIVELSFRDMRAGETAIKLEPTPAAAAGGKSR